MPYITPPPEQQKKLALLVANLQAQDNMISWLGEFVLAGGDPLRRFVRVTADGLVEYETVKVQGELFDDNTP